MGNEDFEKNNEHQIQEKTPTTTTESAVQAPIDKVADAMGQDAAAMLKIASKYGVTHDDPLWSAVLVLLGSREAAQQAVEAAEKIESAGKDLGAMIFRETIAAGGDLAATIDKAAAKTATDIVQRLTKGIIAAVEKPFAQGIKKIEEAIGAVDTHTEKERAVILATWRKDLAAAAAREARRRSLVIALVSWGTILATCAACISVGALGMWGGLDIMHEIVPLGLHLIIRPDGTPACGSFHNALVCGVTH